MVLYVDIDGWKNLVFLLMPIHTYPQYRPFVLVMRALSNERRIRVMQMLIRYSNLTVTDIAHFLGISIMATSKHLHVLLRVGLVVSRRHGGSVEFRTAKDFLQKIRGILTLFQ